MEDYPRDLEKELSRYSVPNPFKKSRKWQVMFVSDDGKVVTVKGYKGLVISLIVALSLMTVVAVSASVLFYHSHKNNKTLKTSLGGLEADYQALSKEMELVRTKQFFSNKIKETLARPKPKEEITKQPAELTKPAKKVVKKSTMIKVDVDDLTVTKNDGESRLNIRFMIRNKGKHKPIAGRVFAVLKPDQAKNQGWVSLPPVMLKKGVPSRPSKGQFFSINNFKSVKFRFNNRFSDDHYKNMTIYVYSTDGEKAFEKTFPIKIDVRNKKQSKKPVAAKKPAEKPVQGAKKPSGASSAVTTAEKKAAAPKPATSTPGAQTVTTTTTVKSEASVSDNKKETPGGNETGGVMEADAEGNSHEN